MDGCKNLSRTTRECMSNVPLFPRTRQMLSGKVRAQPRTISPPGRFERPNSKAPGSAGILTPAAGRLTPLFWDSIEASETKERRSTRRAADDLVLSNSTVHEARRSGVRNRTPAAVTGRDGGGFGRPLHVENLAAPAVHQGGSLPAGESISGRIVAALCRRGTLFPDRRSRRPLEL